MLSIRLPRRLVARAAVAAMAGGLWLGVASAAEPGVPAPLRQALQSAWQQHPTYRATEAQLAAAKARLDAAGQPLYNPELELVRDDEGPDTTSSAGLNLTLDLSGKRRVRRDAASARVDLAYAEARIRRRDFAQQWLTGWAELQASNERVATGQRRVALVSRFAELAKKQFVADDISGLERDLAQLALDEANADQAQLQAEQAQAEAAFRSVGGSAESLGQLDVTAVALPAPKGVTADATALPDLQAAQAAAAAADREVLVARRNRIADPTLAAYSGRKTYQGGGPSDGVWGVTVTVPLFVRNSYRAEVVAAQAEADAAQADLERVQIELDANQRRAVNSYTAAYTAWNGWKRSRGTDVERRANLLERLWREGELSTADYLLQLNQTLDTELAGAELQARLWRTYTDYLAATGRLETWAGLEATP